MERMAPSLDSGRPEAHPLVALARRPHPQTRSKSRELVGKTETTTPIVLSFYLRRHRKQDCRASSAAVSMRSPGSKLSEQTSGGKWLLGVLQRKSAPPRGLATAHAVLIRNRPCPTVVQEVKP